jgi:hypothetical protein
MSGAVNEKIREKVNKLLAMAGDKSSPQEASIAMEMAQKLIREHGLTQLDLKSAELKVVKVSSMFSITRPKDYENYLAYIVSEAFGCHFYWSNGRPGKEWTFGEWWFVGRPDQVAVAEHFMTVLQRTMYRGRADLVASLKGSPAKEKTVEGNGYCVAFCSAIYKRLVPVEKPDKKAAEAAVGGVDDEPGKNQKSKTGHLGAMAGYADGQKQGLHRPMAAADTTSRNESV